MRNFLFFSGAFFFSWFFVVFVNTASRGIGFSFADWDRVRSSPQTASVSGLTMVSPEIELTAQSAILLEARSNTVLFEKNAFLSRPSASLAKIFTGVAAYENYSPSARVRITEGMFARNGSKYKTYSPGEFYSVDMLLHSLLIESSNVAAYALASGMAQDEFVAKMNEKAKLLGFKETVLLGPSGLDEEGSRTNAWEIAKLGEYLLYNEALGEMLRMGTYLLRDAYGNVKRKMFTTNELWDIPGLVAAKTGFSDEAQGNLLLIVKHPKKPDEFLISVVMGSQDRASDTLRLLDLVR